MDINEAFDLADQELYKVKGSKKNSYSLKNYYKRIYEVQNEVLFSTNGRYNRTYL